MSLYKGEQLIAGVAESVGNIDNVTITQNSSNEIQTVAVKNQNATANNAIKTWTGTQAQYDAITTKDPTTLYNVTDIDPSYSVNTQYKNIGAIVQSVVPLTDAGLHLLDGSLIQMGVYSEFVEYMADLYGDGTNIPSYFCTETEWQNSVTAYGVCGKFVYDSTNNTVRLPKVTGKLDGTTDVSTLGDLAPLMIKLPNITGSLNFYSGNGTGTGAITYTKNSGSNNPGGGNMLGNCTLDFDASRSSSVYSGNGTDTTIHEQAINVLLYIVIATSTKTDIQVDIDNIAADLNGKADTDLTNVTNSAKVMMSGMGMPSSKYINLTLGSSGSTYTAPANGYYNIARTVSSQGQYVDLTNITTNFFISQQKDTSGLIRICTPVRKGDVLRINYTATGGGTYDFFRFFYAEGSKD